MSTHPEMSRAPESELAGQALGEKSSDNNLIAAITAGDEAARQQAAELLYRRYYGTVRGHARASLKRYGLPSYRDEDIAQEVMTKLLGDTGKLATFDPNQSFKTWLYRVVENHIIDQSRGRIEKGKSREISAEEMLEIKSPIPGPDEHAQNKELRGKIAESLADMKPELAQVVKMYYQEEFLAKEIAEQLGIPINTVKTRLFDARLILRKKLGPLAESLGMLDDTDPDHNAPKSRRPKK